MIKSTQELKQFWNSFSNFYSGSQEAPNMLISQQLTNIMDIENCKNILEVGCGSGIFTLHNLQRLPKGTKYTSIDLSDEMLKIAQERIESAQLKLDGIEHKFIEASAEDLSMIPDGSVDCYIAPLILHLVENPDKMLKEIRRVLKKGGVFGCSVWGKKENSPFFTLMSDRYKEFGIETPNVRSNFHLGDKEKLVQMAKDAGLDVEYCWEEFVFKPFRQVQDLEKIYNLPSNQKIFQSLEPSKVTEIKQAAEKVFLEHKKTLKPFGFEALLMIAYNK